MIFGKKLKLALGRDQTCFQLGKMWGSGYETDHTTILWHVSWTREGLVPVKPAVFFKHSIKVPPNSTVQLKAVQS